MVDYKQGWRTSEFWITLTPIVVAVLAIFGVHAGSADVSVVLAAVGGVCAAAYTLGRSIVKAFRLNHLASVADSEARVAEAKVYAAANSAVAKTV